MNKNNPIARTAAWRRTREAIKSIKAAVCAHYGMTEHGLLSKTRLPSIAHPRQVAMALCVKRKVGTVVEIGMAFDAFPAAAYNAAKSVQERVSTPGEVRTAFEQIESTLAA